MADLEEGQPVQVRRSGTWADARVVSIEGDRVIVRVAGKRRGYDRCDVRTGRTLVTVRREVPTSDEADSYELARERSAGAVPAPLRAVPKTKTPRSRSHLDFVRSLPCAWCKAAGRTEASHHGIHGTSIKAPDYRAIPLCVECHRHHGDHFVLPKSTMNPDQTREWFKDRALDVCTTRLEERS